MVAHGLAALTAAPIVEYPAELHDQSEFPVCPEGDTNSVAGPLWWWSPWNDPPLPSANAVPAPVNAIVPTTSAATRTDPAVRASLTCSPKQLVISAPPSGAERAVSVREFRASTRERQLPGRRRGRSLGNDPSSRQHQIGHPSRLLHHLSRPPRKPRCPRAPRCTPRTTCVHGVPRTSRAAGSRITTGIWRDVFDSYSANAGMSRFCVFPDGLSLRVVGDAGHDRDRLRSHLDGGVGMGEQVVVPVGVGGGPCPSTRRRRTSRRPFDTRRG